jgi:membrane glycosyltransferase
VRDARSVSWRQAAESLWPHTLFGLVLHAALLLSAPVLWLWALPFTLGYLLAVPFAVATASPAFEAWCASRGLCAVPEEVSPPPEVLALIC